MDMNTLDVSRVPGGVGRTRRNKEFLNSLSLVSLVSLKPSPDWPCQHRVVARLGRYLRVLRGKGKKKKAIDGQSGRLELQMWLSHGLVCDLG